jgi:hypothetical protein
LGNSAEAGRDIGGVIKEQGEIIAGGAGLEQLEAGGCAVEEERGWVGELFRGECFEEWEGFVVEAVLYEPAGEPELEVAAEEGGVSGAGEIGSKRSFSGAAGVDELLGGFICECEGIDESIEGIFGGELVELGVVGPGLEDLFDTVGRGGVLFEPVLELGANGGGWEPCESD